MSNFWIAMFAAIGASMWTFNKFNKRTGGNSQKSIGGAALVGFFVLIIMLGVLSLAN